MDTMTMAIGLIRHGFYRRADFEKKMVELSVQNLEETRATRRDIASLLGDRANVTSRESVVVSAVSAL